METESPSPTTLAAMHDLVQRHLKPQVVDVAERTVLVTAGTQAVHDLTETLDKHRAHPRRAKGTSTHDTLDSLVAHARRHATADSAAFCAILAAAPQIVAVYNYQPPAGDPADERGAWRDHRAAYTFPLSEAWTRWNALAGRWLTVQEFAELLEAGITDVADPAALDAAAPRLPGVAYASPAELLTLSQGLTVRVEQQVADHRRLDNGTAQLVFTEAHTNEHGAPLRVPNGFMLGVPVFAEGEAYALPARLRYRVQKGAVVFQVALHNAATVRRDAIRRAAERFAAESGVPLFYGVPDA